MRRPPRAEPYHGFLAVGGGPEFDAILELGYDDMEGYQSAIQFWQSQAGQVIRDDEEKFMDRNCIVSFVVEEKIIK